MAEFATSAEHKTLAKVDDLVIDPRNARLGDVSAITQSLLEFGQHRPAVVQRSTGKVIVGNHMVMAIKALGWEECWVLMVDDDDVTAVRRGLTDNATGDLATWDPSLLAELLREVGPVPGYDQVMLDELEQSIDRAVAEGSKEAGPLYPIVAKFNEQYDYVLVIASNPIDVAWLHTKFQLRSEQSYKNNNKGVARVVTVERAKAILESE